MKRTRGNPNPRLEGRSVRVFVLVALATLIPSQVLAAQAAGTPTFTRDIAPILQRSCQTCHRPNSVAPMSLITYDEVRPWARAIKRRTALRSKMGVMPPWFIDKTIGIQAYKDDVSLNEQEIVAIADWADSGAPRGNPADMPPPRIFASADEWAIGTPDLILDTPPVTLKTNAPTGGVRWPRCRPA